jgi:hypothetical protein
MNLPDVTTYIQPSDDNRSLIVVAEVTICAKSELSREVLTMSGSAEIVADERKALRERVYTQMYGGIVEELRQIRKQTPDRETALRLDALMRAIPV